MALVRPRLNDHYGLAFTQEQVDFAIPFLDEDIPFYVDPFLLWKSPSLQDNSLHAAVISSFNHLGYLSNKGREREAANILVALSECTEVGLGSAKDKLGHRIGEKTAVEILSLFSNIPQLKQGRFEHIEEIQLYVEQVASDRISDVTCSLLESFLIDYTLDQCAKLGIPTAPVELQEVFDYRTKRLQNEKLDLPVNPINGRPILLVPKRWLRHQSWINYEDYFDNFYPKLVTQPTTGRPDHVAVLGYNRQNYDAVQTYIREKERTHADCKNDPLFNPIPVFSAKRKVARLRRIPTGKTANADREYEDLICQLMTSLLYPQMDFAAEQSRTDSGVLIRDLIFYNSRSTEFLKEIFTDYGSRQIVFELKNVREVEREHINQLNRYLAEQFGHFGIIVTRNPLPKPVFRNTLDLWSGQRKCVIALTDQDVAMMVTLFESKQRLPIEVITRAYVEFARACPS